MAEASADVVVRAAAVHTMDPAVPPAATIAVRQGRIIALAGPDEGFDAVVGPDTTVLDDPGLVVLPAFVDTHNHLMFAGRNVLGVPVAQAANIVEFVDLIRERAARTPAGEWILTGADWHELRLAERRMPTAEDLDRATPDHPVLVMRGGHNGVLNSAGMRLAGIGPDTPDVPGGFIARDAAGRPTGWVQDAALELAQQVLPPLPPERLADGLVLAAAEYAAHGIGTVRDPAVSPQEWHTYLRTAAAGELSVRSHAMIWTTPGSVEADGSMDAYLDGLEVQGIRPGIGEGGLRLWGLKLVLDGGVEAAALEQPYADRPGFHGELMWDHDGLVHALTTAVRRGWPVGTHAFGDRAVALLLDAIRDVVVETGPLPPGMLVVEHGGLIGNRIADAAELGVHVTVQQALLDGLAEPLVEAWGADRAAELFPLRELVDAGAWISAGTDHPIGPLDPLRGVYGMVTRRTSAGVLGAGHAITREEAFGLYTVAGASLLGGGATATLAVGAPADLVAYAKDPFTCEPEELLGLSPAFTLVGGRIVHRRS
jgi:predicted amidohydrolase YtcJ